MSIVEEITDNNIKRAEALGRLQGGIIGLLMYDNNISNLTFRMLFNNLNKSYESLGQVNPDMERLIDRAKELNIELK